MKIFISSLDSELGYHLTESLRQDHLLLNGFSLISGTVSNDSRAFMMHDSVHATFDFSKQRDITVKTAIESDVIILDLRYDPAPQVQFILKVLKHHSTKKPIKIIGISNFTTWSNCRQNEFAQTPQDKQTLLEHTINKQHWQAGKLNKGHYPLRVPHPMFVYNYLLEEQILQLKMINKMIEPVVLCTGLLYGKSGFDLRAHLENGIKGTEDWLMGLKNGGKIAQDTFLPVLHVNKLMQTVESMVYSNNTEKPQPTQQYQVLCENQPKSILKIIETINHICGNTKQLNHKPEPTKQQKPPMDLLKPPTSTQNPSSTHTINELNTRSPTANRNRKSSSQSQLITDVLTNVFVPELTFAKDKVKFSLLMNVNFGNEDGKEKIQEKIKETDDNLVEQTEQKFQQNESQTQKAWLLPVIQEFTQYFDCDFKRFLFSEQVLKQQESTQKLPESFMSRYYIIDKNLLTQELNVLVENGTIPQERLATPEEDKKKPNTSNKTGQNRQSPTREAYELVFPELIQHVLTKYRLSHYLVCLKAELIAKVLTLLSEPGFEEHKDLHFISLTSKQPNPTTPSYSTTPNITKSLPVFSDEFYYLYDIQNPQPNLQVESQKVQFDQEDLKKSALKSRKNTREQKDGADQSEELKINLMHQYLLDNLIVYLAEAKHNLKAKGQKYEGKQCLKMFVEELKLIRSREMKLACEEQQ